MKLSRLFICCIFTFVGCVGVLGCGGNNGASIGNPGNPGNPVTPDFTLASQPAQISITAGSTSTLTLNLAWTGTPIGAISITGSGLPSGLSAGQTLPATIPLGSTSASVTLSAPLSAPAGSSTLSLTATATGSSTVAHTYNIPITISALPAPPARTLTRTGYILTGGEPESIVYDKAHKLLWVSVPNLGQVLVIDPAQRKILNRISVPLAGTMDLSLDGTQIVVGSDTLPRLTFIDVASQSITGISLLTTAVVDASFPAFPPYVDATDDPSNPIISYPRFIAGGDVVFLGFGGLFRWSSATNTVAKVKNGNYYAGTTLYRTPDGTKVLITTTENELDVYDAATNAVSAQNQTYSRFAAADPVNPRFALFDSNGYDIVDVNLHQLGAVDPPDIVNNTGANPYALHFSADGTQLFVARSGLFRGSYAFQTVDAVNYKLGSQAPLTNFNGSVYLDAEVPQAVDSTNLIYGLAVGGIVIDDPLNYFTSSTAPRNLEVSNTPKPNYGPVAASTSTMLENLYSSSTLQSVYFDDVPATVSGTQNGVGSNITVTTPPIQTPGPVTIHAFASDGSFSAYPAAFTYGTQAVALEPNAGPASGGITSNLLAYGVSGGPSTFSVTVGGVAATVSSVTLVGGDLPYLLPLYYVQFVVPPGTAGTSADVSLTASSYTATLPHAFTYEPAITNVPFPSSTIPNGILFDAQRQQAYLLSPTRIDVFSLKSNSFLAPIIPPTKNGTLGLSGLDLSLDGKTLVIADKTDWTLAFLNPDNPTNATLITLPATPQGTFGPLSVIANSKGTYFISPGNTQTVGGGAGIWEFDPVANTLTLRVGPLNATMQYFDCRLLRSPDGKTVLVQSFNEIPVSSLVWSAATDKFTAHTLTGFANDGAVSPDGSLVSAFVDPDTQDGTLYQYVFDTSENVLASMSDPDWLHTGWLWGQFFDPSGTLFYVPDNVGIDIYDVHTGHLQRKIGVKEAPNTTVYTAATSDTTGNTLLLLTNNGLDVISDVPPLAVRSVTPLPNSASAGTVITVKGTDFVAGTTVTLGGNTVPATVTDSHTLSFSLPAVVAGNTLTLTNPDGSSYTF